MVEQPSGVELRFAIDTNILDDRSDAMVKLRQLAYAGQIELCRTNVTDRELEQAKDPSKLADLLRRADEHRRIIGAWVLGHARLGVDTVLGSDDDATSWNQLWAVLWPSGSDRATSRPQHIRDAWHIHTAIRAGLSGFITRDEHLVRKRAAIVKSRLGFSIITPEVAVRWATRATGSLGPIAPENDPPDTAFELS